MAKKYFFKKVLRKIPTQGGQFKRISSFLTYFYKEIMDHYHEDNKPTLDSFINDCHEEAIKEYWKIEETPETK